MKVFHFCCCLWLDLNPLYLRIMSLQTAGHWSNRGMYHHLTIDTMIILTMNLLITTILVTINTGDITYDLTYN
jgi:hypothetical protein